MESEDSSLSIILDLTRRGDRNEILSFRISLHADGIEQLMNASAQGDRVYELFSIRRHGDIKRYLWIRVIEAAERIMRGYRWARKGTEWPENECSFLKWDDAFELTWDEQPEECAWYHAKLLPAMKEFIDYWFDCVHAAKKLLRQSEDIFIQKEVRLIESGKHDYEYETEPPYILTERGTRYEPAEDQYPEWFYEDLTQILGQHDINSVASRSADLRTFRLMCAEQLKRCSDTPETPKTVFPVSVINLTLSNNSFFPRASRWGGYVLYSEEGLGYGDLLVDMNRRVGRSAKALVEQYYRAWPDRLPIYILANEEMGEIEDYSRKILRETCLFLYKKT